MKTYILCIDKSEEQALLNACANLNINYDIINKKRNIIEVKIQIEDELQLFFLGCKFNDYLSDDIILAEI